MAGANAMTKLTRPIACPLLSRGKESKMSDMTMTMSTPVEAACMMRPSKSTPKTGAIAATRLPAPKSVIPPRNSCRVVNLPMNQAARGMTTASVSA